MAAVATSWPIIVYLDAKARLKAHLMIKMYNKCIFALHLLVSDAQLSTILKSLKLQLLEIWHPKKNIQEDNEM